MTPISATHADHDPLAVAAFAAGDAEGAELDTAMAQVAGCADCAALHHDLRSIAAAIPALPAPVRTRDFRLTAGQAATLRPSGWHRLLVPFAGPRFAVAGPLGTGLATLGLAGLLAAGVAGMPIAGSAPAPQAASVSTDAADVLLATPEAGGAQGQAPAAGSEAPAAASQAPAPAASEAPAPDVTMGMAPGDPAPVGGAASGQAGTATGGVVAAVPEAASPAADATAKGTGEGGPLGAAAVDPKSTASLDRTTSSAPGDGAAAAQAIDTPVQAPPATSPLVLPAALLLVAGVLLGGLRLVARRVA